MNEIKSDTMDRRQPIGISTRHYVEYVQAGMKDVDDYIEALKDKIRKLEDATKAISKELQNANKKIEELEGA